MLTIATKTLSTGANGQNADAASPFDCAAAVTVVVKLSACHAGHESRSRFPMFGPELDSYPMPAPPLCSLPGGGARVVSLVPRTLTNAELTTEVARYRASGPNCSDV
jgi:hypothetical protein